ncbi:MAG: tellurite resistance TerB family protein [Pseudomonadota bacterium]
MTDITMIFKPTDPQKDPLPDVLDLAKDFEANDWTISEAFMGLILSAAFSDGNMGPEEREEIGVLIKRSRTMKRLSPNDLHAVNQTVAAKLKERDNAVEEACQALPLEMRTSVFAHCVDIILLDGMLHPSEATFLNDIAKYMGLDAELGQNIMSVLMLKNRF